MRHSLRALLEVSVNMKTIISQNKHSIAEKLLDLGADPNQILGGDSLLIHAIKNKSESSALFLLNNKARVVRDFTMKSFILLRN